MTSPGTACQPLGALAMTVGTGLTWARWKAMDWSLARNWIRHWIGPNQTAYSMLIPWSHLQSHSVSGWNLWLHCSKKIGASFTRVFKVWISESLTCLRSLECEALIHKSAQHVTSKECRFCTVSWCFLWLWALWLFGFGHQIQMTSAFASRSAASKLLATFRAWPWNRNEGKREWRKEIQ